MDTSQSDTKKIALIGGGFALLILFVIFLAYITTDTTTVMQPTTQFTQPTVEPTVEPTVQPVIQPAVQRQITTKEDCNQAGMHYLQATGHTPGRPIQVGSWGWVKPGCSVQSGGDWAIHWNTNPAGVDTKNFYTTVDSSHLV